MATALRKTLALTTVALVAALLPAGGAGAAGSVQQSAVPGRYCLANTWGVPDVSSKPCDSADRGQHWTLAGHQIALTGARGYCLANTWGKPDVSSKPCDPNDQGQYWNVDGQKISLAFAPGYCLANTWGTPAVSSKPCDSADRGQNWVVFNEQISLALV